MPELKERLQAALGAAYRLEAELSGGAMSRVFRATDTRLDRAVVVKVLPPDLGAGVNIARFQREIAVAARLQHPHIVPLLAAGSHDDLLYYVMPYIAGDSLRARLAAEDTLPIADVRHLLREIADALAYAHAQGIVHRDIKPGNVLLSGKHALVTDFGVAKAVEESTGKATLMTVGVALGTPAYMAPEQAAADPSTDHRADIYALGAVGYEMLTGRTPFTGTSPQTMLAARLTQSPEHLAKYRDGVPDTLASVVMRCLATEPAERWQSANDVVAALEGMVTPPTGSVPPPVRRRRVTPLRVVIALAVGAIGVLGGWGLMTRDSGTLFATGVLEARDRLVLAEFENRTSDSTLGPSVSEALRIDLAQSPAVRLLDATAIAAALRRMNQPAGTPIDVALARDIAQREGAKAVVRGQIDPVGPGYVLAAEVVAAQDGAVLVALRETAQDDRSLIDAVDRLSKRLRRQIGESLRTIRASEPLERVTTGSLDALNRYSQAIKAEQRGEWDRAAALLEQAIALDTGFAMAHRKLSAVLTNTFAAQSRSTMAAASAFRHRDRLPPLERHLTTAFYYKHVEPVPALAEEAYRAVLEIDPDDFIAANNLTLLHNDARRFAAAESLGLRHLGGPNVTIYMNVAQAQLGQGKTDDAAATARAYELIAPGNPVGIMLRAFVAENLEAFDSAEAYVRSLRPSQLDLSTLSWQAQHLFALAQLRGRLRAAAAEERRSLEVHERRRLPGSYLGGSIQLAMMQLRFEQAPEAARRTVAAALKRHPLDSIKAEDRPYSPLIMFYAESGQRDSARRLHAEYQTVVPEQLRRRDDFRHAAAGALAFAEGRWDDALRAYRAWYDESNCSRCGLYEMARVYDHLGQEDSALVIGERAVTNLGLYRVFEDTWSLARTYKRLGELYEQRGDTAKARTYYGKFVDLWKEADPVLQPTVRDVRGRLAKLSTEPTVH